MPYHVIHSHTALLCNLGLILCTSTIIPDDQWTAFVIETALNTDKLL